MSYMKRSPCKKYYEKSTKDDLQKSMSATRFIPFQRTSDTTSESESDDFKIDPAEDSSFSRSSSESCNSYGVNTRYQCILKDLDEITSLDKELHHTILEKNESLNDFRSRLNLRRKVKNRHTFTYPDDDKADNSCDSTTIKAHEEILRNANLLKQEQVETNDGNFSGKKMFHKDIQFSKRFNKSKESNTNRVEDEDVLMNEFDKILHINNQEEEDEEENNNSREFEVSTAKSIARSSTENFLLKSNPTKGKSTASPRFRRKTHSQVLKAASSIPSLIFSNKSLKLNKSSTNFNYESNQDKFANNGKKVSVDDDLFTIGGGKTRRSPLRVLGNFVDDKIFRGRWSSTKRAKSTDEITWALANEDLIQDELSFVKETNRKKSLGVLSMNSNSSNNTDDTQDKKSLKNSSDKYKNLSNFIGMKIFDDGYNAKNSSGKNPSLIEVKKRKSSNPCTRTELRSIADSSFESSFEEGHFSGAQPTRHKPQSSSNVISAETMAEIEAFEELLKNHLQED